MPDYNPGQEGVAVTASPNLVSEKARFDPNGSAGALLTALGTPSTQAALQDFQQVYQRKKLEDQSLKMDAYTEQFMQDHQGGAVSQAQVKERFPEMVPVIAARVAESIGKRQGAMDFAKVVDEVNADDSLRLDTAKRNAFIQQKRQEFFGAIPQGNEFYGAGFVQAMNQQVSQQELKWQAQTAQYHEQVQKEALSNEAVGAFNSADPKAALEAIDTNWSKSSSLNNVERNKVYVDAVIKHAAVSDDPAVLDKIPQRYLSVDSKAEIVKARLRIRDQQFAQWQHGREFEAYQRSETDRKGKLDILQKIGSGQPVDPAQYIRSPELHSFAVQAMSTPSVPESASKAAVQAFRTSILSAGMVGSVGSQADLTKAALSAKGMNPSDRAALVDEIPKLMEGSVLMNDPQVRRAFADNLAARMDDLGRSSSAQIQRLMGTGNLRGNAQAIFEGEIQSNFQAAFQESGEWPKGFAAKKIVDAAVAKTSAYVDRMTSVEGLRVQQQDVPPTAPASASGAAPKAAPKAPAGLPKGVTLIK